VRRGAWLGCLLVMGCYERLEFDVPAAAAGSSGSSGSAGASGAAQGGAGASAGGSPSGCLLDAECPLASLRCDVQSGSCVDCIADGDCEARGLPRCDAALHRCVECGVDQDCDGGQVCDPTTRRCSTPCTQDQQCPAAARHCDEDRRICVECEADENEGCELTPDRPYCVSPSSRCAACRTRADCDGGQYCDGLTGACVGCRDTRDCPAAQACDPLTRQCVSF
jgi:hypothetical protein